MPDVRYGDGLIKRIRNVKPKQSKFVTVVMFGTMSESVRKIVRIVLNYTLLSVEWGWRGRIEIPICKHFISNANMSLSVHKTEKITRTEPF